MKRFLLPLALLVGFAPVACGGDDDDDDMDTGNDSANDSAASDSTPADGGGMSSSTMETCDSSHQCINDVCECTTPSKEGDACTDDESCVDECEVCM
jgi:hypothetical protein